MVEETFAPGMTVSLVARRHGVAPNQLFTWRRLAARPKWNWQSVGGFLVCYRLNEDWWMPGWRHAVELAMSGEDEIGRLTGISGSRTERASRVERAQMLLAYQENPSFCAVGEKLGVHHQTVQRCVERALAYGALAALDDRPRPGKEPTITPEAKVVGIASVPDEISADAGYCSGANLRTLNRRRINGYIATGRQKHGAKSATANGGPSPAHCSQG
jgi:hypothetical protein